MILNFDRFRNNKLLKRLIIYFKRETNTLIIRNLLKRYIMKNFIIVIISFLVINSCYSQIISGDILDSGRKLLTVCDFVIKSDRSGEVVYEIAVDIKGEITSATIVNSLTTIKSTPLKMEAKNLVNTFKFEPGTFYPKFHHCRVKITFVEK
jgi:hypothetical protein